MYEEALVGHTDSHAHFLEQEIAQANGRNIEITYEPSSFFSKMGLKEFDHEHRDGQRNLAEEFYNTQRFNSQGLVSSIIHGEDNNMGANEHSSEVGERFNMDSNNGYGQRYTRESSEAILAFSGYNSLGREKSLKHNIAETHSKTKKKYETGKIPKIDQEQAWCLYEKLKVQIELEALRDATLSRKWTKDEMTYFFFIVQRYINDHKKTYCSLNPEDWKKISSMMPGKTSKQCERKWQKKELMITKEIVNQMMGENKDNKAIPKEVVNEPFHYPIQDNLIAQHSPNFQVSRIDYSKQLQSPQLENEFNPVSPKWNTAYENIHEKRTRNKGKKKEKKHKVTAKNRHDALPEKKLYKTVNEHLKREPQECPHSADTLPSFGQTVSLTRPVTADTEKSDDENPEKICLFPEPKLIHCLFPRMHCEKCKELIKFLSTDTISGLNTERPLERQELPPSSRIFTNLNLMKRFAEEERTHCVGSPNAFVPMEYLFFKEGLPFFKKINNALL